MKGAKKSMNGKKTVTGRVAKVKSNKTKCGLRVKLIVNAESVITCSNATLNVSEKMRKKKVETRSEARFRCPTEGCKQKSTIHRYRTLFDHFAD